RIFTYDHARINLFLRSDEKFAPRLNVIERVSSADSGLHRNQHAAIAAFDLALELRVLAKEMTHDAFAAGQIHEVALKSDQTTRGNDCLNRNTICMMIHSHNLTFPRGD